MRIWLNPPSVLEEVGYQIGCKHADGYSLKYWSNQRTYLGKKVVWDHDALSMQTLHNIYLFLVSCYKHYVIKFEMAHIAYSGPWGKPICEKKPETENLMPGSL